MTWEDKKFFKRRLAAIGVIVLIVIAAFASCGSGKNEKSEGVCADPGEAYAGVGEYTVRFGDTLWGIAAKHCPSDYDIRHWIRDVEKLNERTNADIYEGETIKVYLFEAK